MPVGHDLMCRHGGLMLVARTSCRSASLLFRGPRSTLGHGRCLPSCITKRFLTSHKFVSNPSVGHTTSAMSYSPISDRSLRFYLFNKMRSFPIQDVQPHFQGILFYVCIIYKACFLIHFKLCYLYLIVNIHPIIAI